MISDVEHRIGTEEWATQLPAGEASGGEPQGFRAQPGEWQLTTRGIALRMFITCWLIYALHFATNTVREIYPALSLGDHLSFDVSEYVGLHPDIFEIQGRGAFINNNPGASIIGAVPYTLARPLTDRVVERVRHARAASSTDAAQGEYKTVYPLAQEFYRKARERGLDVKFGLAAAVIQAFGMAPLSALSAVVMFYLLLGLTRSRRKALLLALVYAFATPIFYRTAQLNQNLLVSHCALFAFALLWRPWDALCLQRPRYLLAGLLCGWAVVLDYSGVVVLLVLSCYGLARRADLPREFRSRADLVRFMAGVALSLAVLLAYQWAAFGSPFYPAQHYMPPTELSLYGYNGMDWPRLDLLWETAFGLRFGLFTSAPLLLLSFYVPWWRKGGARLLGRRELWCVLAFTVLFFLFCAANQFGRLQFNSGVRYVVPVVPFLFLLAASVLLRMPKLLAALICVLATYWSWCLAMYRDVEQGLGVFESVKHVTLEGLRLPWMVTLERMGYASSASALPLLLLCATLVWTLWRVGAKEQTRQA